MSNEENSHDPNSIANKPPVPPRDDLVQKAADFLSMANVQKSPEDMKIAFLKRKGLSDVEINLAFKKCELLLQNKTFEVGRGLQNFGYPYHPVALPAHRGWLTFRDFANGMVLLAGFLYGLYWFYKKYLWRYLFGNQNRKKPSTEERLIEMENKLSQICLNLDSLKESVENKSSVTKEIQEVKFEVTSVKKLLLNRKVESDWEILWTSIEGKIRRKRRHRRWSDYNKESHKAYTERITNNMIDNEVKTPLH